MWKIRLYIELLKSRFNVAKRQMKWTIRIAKLVWSMRNGGDNATFLALVNVFAMRGTPLAHHAEFYLSNLLKSAEVETRFDGDKITITFSEEK